MSSAPGPLRERDALSMQLDRRLCGAESGMTRSVHLSSLHRRRRSQNRLQVPLQQRPWALS